MGGVTYAHDPSVLSIPHLDKTEVYSGRSYECLKVYDGCKFSFAELKLQSCQIFIN